MEWWSEKTATTLLLGSSKTQAFIGVFARLNTCAIGEIRRPTDNRLTAQTGRNSVLVPICAPARACFSLGAGPSHQDLLLGPLHSGRGFLAGFPCGPFCCANRGCRCISSTPGSQSGTAFGAAA